jgi:hypothetical protein
MNGLFSAMSCQKRLSAWCESSQRTGIRSLPRAPNSGQYLATGGVQIELVVLCQQMGTARGTTPGNKGLTTVNVRVPMQLLRAGVRLAALIPPQAHNQLDSALSRYGIPLTLSQIKPENLEELIEHLEDLTVDAPGRTRTCYPTTCGRFALTRRL